jgi:hypothetical protein
MTRRRLTALVVTVALGALVPEAALAQSVSAADRDSLVRLRVSRGGQAEEVDALLVQAGEARAKGLPDEPLTSKIREGLAKGIAPARIEQVIRQMAGHLESADQLLREMGMVSAGRGHDASTILLAEAFGGGVTPGEVRELRRQVQSASAGPTVEGLTGAAKGLSFIKEAGLPVAEGTAVMVEATRRGFRQHEVLDVGREIKRRESDYQSGRASLRALRDAIARGERPELLFRDSRPDARAVAPERPGTVIDRPAPSDRPEAPRRPDRREPDAGVRPR